MTIMPDPLTAYLSGGPCPTWCDRAGSAHPYRWGTCDDDAARPYSRLHQCLLIDLSSRELRVYVEQLETCADPDQPVTALGPAALWIDVAMGAASAKLGDVTEARGVAVALLEAIDRLEAFGRPELLDGEL